MIVGFLIKKFVGGEMVTLINELKVKIIRLRSQKRPVMIELGPVVGVHVKVRQGGFTNIDAVPDPRLSGFLRAPARWSVV